MFLLNWYRDYLNIRAEYREKQKELEFCDSCEALKLQLAMANDEKKYMLEKLLDKREPEEAVQPPQMFKPVMPGRINWNVRRQMLEQEDRAAAKAKQANDAIITSAAKPANEIKSLTVSEIEREIGVENG